MPTYQYQALQADGSLTQGLLHDASLDSAMQKLMGQGLQVQSIGIAAAAGDPLAAPVRQLSVERPLVNESIPGVHADARGATYTEQSVDYAPNAEMGGYSGHEGMGGPPTGQRNYVATSVVGPLVGKISLTNLSFFYTQLATMLKAGVPMVQSLDTLSKQARDPRFANILREIRGHVEAGRPMTAGMQRYPEAFSPVMLSIIRTGEEGGFLDEALETVAKYTDDEIEIRNLYRRVTIYPKLLIFASIVVILGANAIIGSINNQAGKLSSPLTTASTWYWLAPLIIVLFLFFLIFLSVSTSLCFLGACFRLLFLFFAKNRVIIRV
jgi:type II secretory pathway component PulF